MANIKKWIEEIIKTFHSLGEKTYLRKGWEIRRHAYTSVQKQKKLRIRMWLFQFFFTRFNFRMEKLCRQNARLYKINTLTRNYSRQQMLLNDYTATNQRWVQLEQLWSIDDRKKIQILCEYYILFIMDIPNVCFSYIPMPIIFWSWIVFYSLFAIKSRFST